MTIQRPHMRKSVRVSMPAALLLAALICALAGCQSTQIFPSLQEHRISLRPGDLEASGIAFITPSSATGQEQEKQAVAFTFADVIKRERQSLRVVTLAETLGAVNKAGLADAYKRMYDDYRDTGLLSRDVLQRIGAATGTRYLALLKLLGRLEFVAVPVGRDWRLDRLLLSNPESTLTLDGVWQLGLPRPTTRINVRLE